MTYLVDVHVLSEPTRPAPIILGELQAGILALPPGRKRTQLGRWFAEVVEAVECLPWDAAVSRCWAELVVESKRKGRVLPLLDSLIGATARAHGLTVVTRNVQHFREAGVKVVNPFGYNLGA